MRTLILAGLVVAGLVAAGVISIQKGTDSSNGTDTFKISVDKNKLHQTEEEAAKLGSAVLQQAETSLEQASKQQSSTQK